jgi:GAF domain
MGALIHPRPDAPIARAAKTKQPFQISDIRASRVYRDGNLMAVSVVDDAGMQAIIAVPLLKENDFVGAIAIYSKEARPFTDKQIELLENFASQAVIAIENARLLNELRQRTDDLTQRTTDLTEALEQQTATSEVLRVISSSPGDLKPVFETMLTSAAQICEAHLGGIYRWDGEFAQLVAMTPIVPPAYAAVVRYSPFRPDPKSLIGRSVMQTTAVQFADFKADELYTKQRDPFVVATVELGGFRTGLYVPMLKENEPIGFLALVREDVRPLPTSRSWL